MVYADEVAKGYFGHTMLQVDDVARQVVISFLQIMKTLTFFSFFFFSQRNFVKICPAVVPMMYYTYRKFTSNYRLGIRLHQIISLLYFIDLIRRHSHPHCWVINVPVFFLWVLDKIAGQVYQRETLKVNYFKISEDYSLVYFNLKHAQKNVDNLAQVYFSRLVGYGQQLERKHPFTSAGAI